MSTCGGGNQVRNAFAGARVCYADSGRTRLHWLARRQTIRSIGIPRTVTHDFARELALWGPQPLTARAASRDAAEAYCRTLARMHYENFPLVSWLLPRGLRQHFYNIYAYCRWSDDLADEVAGSEASLELLSWWRGELADCYAGRVRHPVFVALEHTVADFDIPREPFEDLLSAFEQDQRVFRYETFAELRDYCRRSADPVGRLVLRLCRAYNDETVAWSDSICTGLQLANFWQDVSRDFEIGRVYLPREDREVFGYTEEDLTARRTTPAFLELMRFEVERAREFLVGGLPLVERLPGRLQVDVDLFARGGLAILRRIEGIGYRVWDVRPEVTKREAAGLFVASAWRALLRRVGIGRLSADSQAPAAKAVH
ncbi:MAG: squalene synthase HpnC [Planctomycetes bacterium]|nr:squalene synthase HpnC [Planctomycetota bacterium]